MTTTLSYGSSAASENARNNLTKAVKTVSEAAQRISSGLRIAGPADDAAGLALSSKINTDALNYGQAVENVNAGISLVNLAEAAVGELSNILTKLKELTTQGTNTSLTSTQRSLLNSEATALAAEYDRIVSETQYNNINLLDGSFNTRNLQADPVSGTGGLIPVTVGEQLDDLEGSATVGTGSFNTRTTYNVAEARDLAIGSVNGDSNLDVAVVGNSTYIRVLMGNGNGTFTSGVTLTATGISDFYEVQLVDVNNDSNLDVVATASVYGKVAVFLGDGNGSFGAMITTTTAPLGRAIDLADFNGDGNLDLAVASINAGMSVTVLVGNGNGTFGAETTLSTSQNGQSLIAYDINNDSKQDIIYANGSAVYVHLGNGNNTFAAATSFAGNGYYDLALADFNGDNKADLVISSGSDYLNVLLGNGNGTFAAKTTLSTGAAVYGVAITDLNGDGNQDVFAASTDSYISVLLGNGNGTFKARTSVVNTGGSSTPRIEVGDLTGDGVSDLVAALDASNLLGSYVAATTVSTITVDISNYTVAARSLSLVETAITAIRGEEGTIAATSSRLSHAVNYLVEMRDGLDAAYHRIVDADMAEEVAKLVTAKIVQQGAVAVLAQANLQPERAFELLKEL